MDRFDKDKEDGIIDKELDEFFKSNSKFKDAVLSSFDKDKNKGLSEDELQNILKFIKNNIEKIRQKTKLSMTPPPSPRGSPSQSLRGSPSPSPRPGSPRQGSQTKLSKQLPSSRSRSQSSRAGLLTPKTPSRIRGGKSHKSPLEKAIKKMIKSIFRPN